MVDYARLVRIRSAAPHALAVAVVRLALLLVEGGAVQAGRGGGAILSVCNRHQHANGGGRGGEHEGRGAHLVGLLVSVLEAVSCICAWNTPARTRARTDTRTDGGVSVNKHKLVGLRGCALLSPGGV